ncbi:MAG: NCS2 family permease [OM182 bacterium]|uniref:NCS2 family permease n=1 Tax=OM182 bacterium TaxID=2510334 RepID=A0A520S0J3_9GAMM|nr:MAG: NCS2 family permease [OM182 bacterium]
MLKMDRLFKLKEFNTTFSKEILAGLTTFMAMAYIIFVNPQMMADAGMDYGASFVATCIAAAIACFLMGLYANWPVGLAPGMGLNAFFTYTIVGEMGYSWQVALGAVFLAGILFVLMSITRLRAWMLESIPKDLRIAMGVGVGLFIGIIGLMNGGIIADHPATLLTLGDLSTPQPLMACLGFLIIMGLAVRNIPGAIILGILSITVIALVTGHAEYQGLVSAPPSIAPTIAQLDIRGALEITMVSVILAILFVNLFDTAGTLMGVASRAGLMDSEGNIKDIDRALKADSTSSVAGAFFGCSPVTSYVESAAGVSAGGRTGLTACTVGLLFLFAIFFAPLAGMVPAFATAGALIYVALVMMGGMRDLDWNSPTNLLPALIMILMIPLSFSIAHGIAVGFISYVVLKVSAGKTEEINVGIWFLAIIFAAKFAFL